MCEVYFCATVRETSNPRVKQAAKSNFAAVAFNDGP
jgi:hypothetical protein